MKQKKLQRKQSHKTGHWGWTGFQGQTLWDWLDLLIVPTVLLLGGFYFSMVQDSRTMNAEDRRAQAEQRLVEQRAQAEALQAYHDEMATLMLTRDLQDSEQGSPVYTLAQARTTVVMERLDAEDNRSVTRFLTDSGLAGTEDTSISLLRNAYLPSARLAGANLNGADLTGVYLGAADLTNADLVRADLSGAFLRDANLKGADLTGSDLSDAYLDGANLAGAELDEADLSDAFVRNANFSDVSGVTKEQLTEKQFPEGATMPDGSTKKGDHKPTHRKPMGNDRSEADLIEAVEDYYKAVDREDWNYTYRHLDSQTQAMFTEEEWHLKNQWIADIEGLELANMTITLNGPISDHVVGVTVNRTFKDGNSIKRDTLFVYEEGAWLHRFTKEEDDIFMPEASYEEFVEANQSS